MTTLGPPNQLPDLEALEDRPLRAVDAAKIEIYAGNKWHRKGSIPDHLGTRFRVTVQRDVGSTFEPCSACKGEDPQDCPECLGEGGITVHKVLEGSGEDEALRKALELALGELEAMSR